MFVIILFTNRNVFIHWFRAKNKNLKSASPFRLNIVTWLLRQTIPMYLTKRVMIPTLSVCTFLSGAKYSCKLALIWPAHWTHLFDVNYVFHCKLSPAIFAFRKESHKSDPRPDDLPPFFIPPVWIWDSQIKRLSFSHFLTLSANTKHAKCNFVITLRALVTDLLCVVLVTILCLTCSHCLGTSCLFTAVVIAQYVAVSLVAVSFLLFHAPVGAYLTHKCISVVL